MKTLYEILEVSETASNEIIEKAYKVLAKKYHPDLQPAEQKEKAEQEMKQINEAYDILSNEEKRKQYDAKLKLERQQQAEKKQERTSYYENARYNNYNQTTTQHAYKNETAQNSNAQSSKQTQEEIRRRQQMEQEMQKNMQAQYQQKYQEAYENYLRSLGYRIKYKWTWKNYKDFFITICIIIVICAILWFFPPTHNWIVEFYESNHVIKAIIDVVGGIITGIWNAVLSIFQ